LLTAELNETDAIAEAEADQNRVGPHRWTQEEAREAARLSRESRATRRKSEPSTDAEIERGLRERAVSDPRAVEFVDGSGAPFLNTLIPGTAPVSITSITCTQGAALRLNLGPIPP
jgi:hypothetical protein